MLFKKFQKLTNINLKNTVIKLFLQIIIFFTSVLFLPGINPNNYKVQIVYLLLYPKCDTTWINEYQRIRMWKGMYSDPFSEDTLYFTYGSYFKNDTISIQIIDRKLNEKQNAMIYDTLNYIDIIESDAVTSLSGGFEIYKPEQCDKIIKIKLNNGQEANIDYSCNLNFITISYLNNKNILQITLSNKNPIFE
ncbi:MAG: hypothetical protein QG635_301 [Bacteroidota bacterium]|nr:hypothetical protein [Bacteroidota bacterium]